jgi:hypothetical protein
MISSFGPNVNEFHGEMYEESTGREVEGNPLSWKEEKKPQRFTARNGT